ncbi:MAG: LysR family transcriptional regulator [Bdellovibrionota bacterium]
MSNAVDFNKLAIFVRVVDHGSITKAAKFLRQPKSRVSRNIAALEKELGQPLLYRTTRQFNPTEAGRALYQACRLQVYELEAAAASLKEGSNEVSGILRISAAEDMGSLLLGPLIADFKALHPKVSTEVYLSNDIIDLVKEAIDLTIRIGELEDTGFKARTIGHTASILIASPGYLKSAPKISSLSDLAHHPALVFIPDSHGTHWLLTTNGRKEEKVRFQAHCRANNPKILLDLALADQGVALIPEFLCIEALQEGTLKRVLKPYETLPDPIHFVWPGQRETSPKVRAFIDFGLKKLSRYFT